MATYSPVIACTEKNGSRRENYSLPLNGTSSVALYCAWNDALSLVADILDNRRSDPFRFGLLAQSGSIAAKGGESSHYVSDVDNQIIIPDEAEVTITYASLDAEERAGNPTGDLNADWYTENVEPTMEFMTLDHRDFQWGTTPPALPLKAEEAPGRMMPGMKLMRNWRNLVSLPAGTFSLIGKTNNAAYTSTYISGQVFAIDTLLYHPPVLTRTVKRSGASSWDARFSFHYKPQTWNKFWHAAARAYVSMYLREDLSQPYKNYESDNLSSLLT